MKGGEAEEVLGDQELNPLLLNPPSEHKKSKSSKKKSSEKDERPKISHLSLSNGSHSYSRNEEAHSNNIIEIDEGEVAVTYIA